MRRSDGRTTGRLVRVLLPTLAASALAANCGPEPPPGADVVILVHGLGRTPASMLVLQSHLAGEGFRVVNFGYPSRSETIEDLVDRLAATVRECCLESQAEVNFVTHSMGGVLVRSYLARREEPFHGRVVMLSPPNQGSEIVDAYDDSPLLRSLLGPSGVRLGTDSTGIARDLGPAHFSLGIITGDRSINPIGSWLIPGPDDGKVSVTRARLEGAADFIVVHATHTFIVNRRDVAEQVVHYLKHGSFMQQERGPDRSRATWTDCDAAGSETWVRDMRDRVLQFDELGLFAVASFGAPLTCDGVANARLDGMEFGSLRLGFSAGATLTFETAPPEMSSAGLMAPAGFDDEDQARGVLARYAERIGLGIDWSTMETTIEGDRQVHRFSDPNPGLNASADLVYQGSSLVGLRLNMAL